MSNVTSICGTPREQEEGRQVGTCRGSCYTTPSLAHPAVREFQPRVHVFCSREHFGSLGWDRRIAFEGGGGGGGGDVFDISTQHSTAPKRQQQHSSGLTVLFGSLSVID